MGTICFVIWLYYSNWEIEYSYFWKGTLSGIIAGVAMILVNYAISEGVAGPASAICNLGSIA